MRIKDDSASKTHSAGALKSSGTICILSRVQFFALIIWLLDEHHFYLCSWLDLFMVVVTVTLAVVAVVATAAAAAAAAGVVVVVVVVGAAVGAAVAVAVAVVVLVVVMMAAAAAAAAAFVVQVYVQKAANDSECMFEPGQKWLLKSGSQ